MVFSAPAMLTVRISLFTNSSNLVDQPDPALLLKSDRVGDQPVTRSPRRRARQRGQSYQDARARGGMRGRRSNAPARDTANYVKHAEQRACLPTPPQVFWLLPGA